MKKISSVLQHLIKQKGITTTQLGREAGVAQPVTYRLVKGTINNPRLHTLIPFTEYFNITMDQLLGDQPLPDQVEVIEVKPEPIRHQLPLYQWDELTAFPTRLPTEEVQNIETSLSVSEQSFAVVTKDLSMNKDFLANMTLIVDPTLTVQHRDFAIIELSADDAPVFRQVFFDAGSIYLKPTDENFKTIILEKDSRYRFLGVVVQSLNTFRTLLAPTEP